MAGVDSSGDPGEDGADGDGYSLPVLVGLGVVGFVVIFVGVVGLLALANTYVFGLQDLPDETPQTGFELEGGAEVRLVHVGGDEPDSSRVIVSNNGTQNSSWQELAGWDEARAVTHGDAVTLPEAERGDEISVVYVTDERRVTLFRGRVQPSSSTTGTPRLATSSANAPESASSAAKVL